MIRRFYVCVLSSCLFILRRLILKLFLARFHYGIIIIIGEGIKQRKQLRRSVSIYREYRSNNSNTKKKWSLFENMVELLIKNLKLPKQK